MAALFDRQIARLAYIDSRKPIRLRATQVRPAAALLCAGLLLHCRLPCTCERRRYRCCMALLWPGTQPNVFVLFCVHPAAAQLSVQASKLPWLYRSHFTGAGRCVLHASGR